MSIRARAPEETYGPALALARHQLVRSDPMRLAHLAGVPFAREEGNGGFFSVCFLGTPYEVSWPEGSANDAADRSRPDVMTHLILLHYLLTADRESN